MTAAPPAPTYAEGTRPDARTSATSRATRARRKASHGIRYTLTDPDALRAALAAAKLSHKQAAACAGTDDNPLSSSTIDHLLSGRQDSLFAFAAELLIGALTDRGVEDARTLFVMPPGYQPPSKPAR